MWKIANKLESINCNYNIDINQYDQCAINVFSEWMHNFNSFPPQYVIQNQ